MRIDFHYIHVDQSALLEAHAEKTFASLAHLISGLDPEGTSLLKLEFVRATQHHHKGMIYTVKAGFDLQGKVFHAEATGDNMHRVLDDAKHKLMHAVERHKEQVRGRHTA